MAGPIKDIRSTVTIYFGGENSGRLAEPIGLIEGVSNRKNGAFVSSSFLRLGGQGAEDGHRTEDKRRASQVVGERALSRVEPFVHFFNERGDRKGGRHGRIGRKTNIDNTEIGDWRQHQEEDNPRNGTCVVSVPPKQR